MIRRNGGLPMTTLASFRAIAAAIVLLAAIQRVVAADAPLKKAWYTPAELLTSLAERDGIRWALPETLAGRAFVGDQSTTEALLDEACKQ